MTKDTFKEIDVQYQNNSRHKWPSVLGEISDVICQELQELGDAEDDALRKANEIAFAIGRYFGGNSFYLPTGKLLKTALRDYEVFKRFNGSNIPELTRRFELSESHIYAIIRNQRKLQKERNDKKLGLR